MAAVVEAEEIGLVHAIVGLALGRSGRVIHQLLAGPFLASIFHPARRQGPPKVVKTEPESSFLRIFLLEAIWLHEPAAK